MADDLIIFSDGQKITAEDTNDNNRYLKSLNTDSITTLQTYIDGQLAQIQANMTTQISNLNTQISSANSAINKLTYAINDRWFRHNPVGIGNGTTSLSSYLPQDNSQYWVLITGGCTGYGSSITVSSDICSGVYLGRGDYDAGRSTSAAGAALIPVGAGRAISVSGAEWVTLMGYARL